MKAYWSSPLFLGNTQQDDTDSKRNRLAHEQHADRGTAGLEEAAADRLHRRSTPQWARPASKLVKRIDFSF